ncbi:MAG TPA: amidohydrolase family protein [Acidimicrobiia bacterium]|nr:amidohydrolase family protein [Acidimicrobiia bacterium]
MSEATTPAGWIAAWKRTEAPKPEVATVDVHAHIMVAESAEMTRPHFKPEFEPRTFYSSPVTKQVNSEFYELAKPMYTDPAVRLADMDAMGIDRQLVALTPFHYFYWADIDLAARVAALQNEAIAETVASNPGRLTGVGTLPLAHPYLAVAEVSRIVDLGFPAVEIGADVNGEDLDDPALDPVWAALEEAGLVVILHPAGFTEAKRLTDYYLVNVIGMPLSTTLAVTRMILGGVFERHPGLRMVLVHGGGFLPFYWARTDHAFRHRPEMRGHIDRLPSEYLSDMWFDLTVFDPSMVEQLVARFGADRLLIGTDYPFDMGETDPLALLAAANVSDVDRLAIAGENAARLFNLS